MNRATTLTPLSASFAHVPHERIRGIYNRAEYLPERRKMMDDWANYLDELRERARRIYEPAIPFLLKKVAAAKDSILARPEYFAVFFCSEHF